MQIGTKRDPALTLVFILLTCGIYYLYFIYKASSEVGDFTGDYDYPPGVEVALSLVTCGLWNIYWDYRMGKKVARMSAEVGLPATDNSTLYLILDLLGAGGFASLGLINPVLQQDGLNRIWDAAMTGGMENNGAAAHPKPNTGPRRPRPPMP